jgi:hypothetical protein
LFSRLDYGSLALRPAALLALLVGADQILIQPTRTFTTGLPTVWSPAPSPDITTVPTGQFALAGLSPTRTSTSFTALTGPICARALKCRVLLELETRGHQDWPVKSATRRKVHPNSSREVLVNVNWRRKRLQTGGMASKAQLRRTSPVLRRSSNAGAAQPSPEWPALE